MLLGTTIFLKFFLFFQQFFQFQGLQPTHFFKTQTYTIKYLIRFDRKGEGHARVSQPNIAALQFNGLKSSSPPFSSQLCWAKSVYYFQSMYSFPFHLYNPHHFTILVS